MALQEMPARISLRHLLAGLLDIEHDILVTAPTLDARLVDDGGLFLAASGSQSHGLEYAEQALQRGVSVIVYDPVGGGDLLAAKIRKQSAVRLIELTDLMTKVSGIAARFYAQPSAELSVVGVTGTNGKTSVSHFIAQALNAAGGCAVIGTLGWGELPALQQTINTTPDAVSVQAQLANLLQAGVSTVAMEVSSHGLDQGRVKAVAFDGAVFTNLSHDHLDYHKNMAAYGQAKLALFQTPSLRFVVLNDDDAFSQTIRESLSAGVDIYSFSRRDNMAEKGCLFIANERLTKSGLSFDVTYAEETLFIKSTLFGLFNIDNLVATLAVLLAKGDGFAVAVNKVQQLVSVAGRMQLLSKTAKQPSVLVDYAHTPDALKLALMSLREHCSGKLKLLFGCGGNRDQAKRALMGAIASEYADEVIISNDNPRFESAEEIAAQIKAGAKDGACLTVELDRAQAIEQLIVAAKNDDIILIAGKGHEVYQQVAGEETPFSDAAVGLRALQRRSASLLGGGQ